MNNAGETVLRALDACKKDGLYPVIAVVQSGDNRRTGVVIDFDKKPTPTCHASDMQIVEFFAYWAQMLSAATIAIASQVVVDKDVEVAIHLCRLMIRDLERKSEGNITMLATEFKKDKPNADAK